jgi:tRNA (adenine57-N1/adenine58-N1)-methyltransferase
MKEEGFASIETVEVMMRHLEARVGMTRPSNIMIGHTAYLVFGRTTKSSASVEPSRPGTSGEAGEAPETRG